MTEHCTCGTQLVEDARFCHRCGRPTREILVADVPPPLPVEAQAAPASPLVPAQIPVSFRNPLALRVASVMSLLVMLMMLIPGWPMLIPVWWLVAGWSTVAIYRRLTGAALTVSAGARLGAITGVLAFAVITFMLALSMAFNGRQLLDEAVKQSPQVEPMIHDPAALGAVFLIFLVFLFVVIVGTCAAGGALGARLAARGGVSQAPGA